MPFYFIHDDKSLDVEDVPLDVYVDIEAKTGVAWYQLTVSPPRHAAAAALLAEACAKQLGVSAPKLTPKTLTSVFELLDETSRPTEFSDGMPDPKAPDTGQETT